MHSTAGPSASPAVAGGTGSGEEMAALRSEVEALRAQSAQQQERLARLETFLAQQAARAAAVDCTNSVNSHSLEASPRPAALASAFGAAVMARTGGAGGEGGAHRHTPSLDGADYINYSAIEKEISQAFNTTLGKPGDGGPGGDERAGSGAGSLTPEASPAFPPPLSGPEAHSGSDTDAETAEGRGDSRTLTINTQAPAATLGSPRSDTEDGTPRPGTTDSAGGGGGFSQGMTLESVGRTLTQEIARVILDVQRLDNEVNNGVKRKLRKEVQSRRTLAHGTSTELKRMLHIMRQLNDKIDRVRGSVRVLEQSVQELGGGVGCSSGSDGISGAGGANNISSNMNTISTSNASSQQSTGQAGGAGAAAGGYSSSSGGGGGNVQLNNAIVNSRRRSQHYYPLQTRSFVNDDASQLLSQNLNASLNNNSGNSYNNNSNAYGAPPSSAEPRARNDSHSVSLLSPRPSDAAGGAGVGVGTGAGGGNNDTSVGSSRSLSLSAGLDAQTHQQQHQQFLQRQANANANADELDTDDGGSSTGSDHTSSTCNNRSIPSFRVRRSTQKHAATLDSRSLRQSRSGDSASSGGSAGNPLGQGAYAGGEDGGTANNTPASASSAGSSNTKRGKSFNVSPNGTIGAVVGPNAARRAAPVASLADPQQERDGAGPNYSPSSDSPGSLGLPNLRNQPQPQPPQATVTGGANLTPSAPSVLAPGGGGGETRKLTYRLGAQRGVTPPESSRAGSAGLGNNRRLPDLAGNAPASAPSAGWAYMGLGGGGDANICLPSVRSVRECASAYTAPRPSSFLAADGADDSARAATAGGGSGSGTQSNNQSGSAAPPVLYPSSALRATPAWGEAAGGGSGSGSGSKRGATSNSSNSNANNNNNSGSGAADDQGGGVDLLAFEPLRHDATDGPRATPERLRGDGDGAAAADDVLFSSSTRAYKRESIVYHGAAEHHQQQQQRDGGPQPGSGDSSGASSTTHAGGGQRRGRLHAESTGAMAVITRSPSPHGILRRSGQSSFVSQRPPPAATADVAAAGNYNGNTASANSSGDYTNNNSTSGSLANAPAGGGNNNTNTNNTANGNNAGGGGGGGGARVTAVPMLGDVPLFESLNVSLNTTGPTVTVADPSGAEGAGGKSAGGGGGGGGTVSATHATLTERKVSFTVPSPDASYKAIKKREEEERSKELEDAILGKMTVIKKKKGSSNGRHSMT